MLAYFVHNTQNRQDTIVLPEIGCRVPVNTERMQRFIAVNPAFSDWSGDSCAGNLPEAYGTIVAVRDDCGDVAVRHANLWRERMDFHLNGRS